MASESTRISIKLLIDQERNKVILVEAGNDFVDTLGDILICGKLMNRDVPGREMDVVKDETKGESMFFTTDGLVVMKGLPGNLIQFLHKLGIKNFHQIKEEVLEIDSYEMSNLLSYSLVSKTTLTDALLRKQRILSGEKSLLVAPNMEETVEIDVKTRVKIILRKSDRKILFAETSEDFVDLLFSFLTIPFDSELNIPLVDVEQQVISIGQVEALALLKACLCSSSPLSALKNYIVKKRKREPLQ
ncbi:uncharacterized protein LOC128036047 [Gossypium raimondii]|uniref:uncharacterized protein LOC128036047 n=1 Tax=Gossypium raimondii TaxID=29730 RepID=UPI00227D5082|nr:uncharacterized protein LOC128036047 [Gossypium raimondii]